MQAIILAAGMGRRLGAYTKENTKCMVSVNGVRLIDRVLGQLSRLGLSRVTIVVGYKGDSLKAHIGGRYDGVLRIEYVENPVYDRTNNIYSLFLVRKRMEEEDTLLIESDLIFSDNLFPMIMDAPSPNVALVARYESWMDGTMVKIDAENNIVNFIPKKAFDYADVGEYYKTVNIYKFSKEFSKTRYVPFLEAYSKALGDNEYYEQVLRVITHIDNADLKALPVGGEKWYEIDDVQDLDIAETLFAEGGEMFRRYNCRYGGHWRFPKLLDYCYLVNPYFPPQRMKDELKANFDILLTEYPSGMLVNSMIAAKNFGISQDYVVVGNGAAELIKSLMEQLHGRVGVIYPTFEEYPNRLAKERIVQYIADNDTLSYDADDLMAFFGDKEIGTLLLINPDNPSGNFIDMDGVLRLADWCDGNGITFVVDESFVDFSEGFEHNSLLHDEILEVHRLVVMKSISKSFGVPGLRLGILACADRQLICRMRKDVSIWNINSFAEFYMQIYGKYAADYTAACHRFISERERFGGLLRQITFLRVLPSQAIYFCCEVSDRDPSAELAMSLLEGYDIMIKDCGSKSTLKDRNYIRMSVRDTKDNDVLIAALRELER
ncbi:MAG: aminotransferase class I/II-fold pyridoxal phosphate-dependent enzyme [Bacteroidaceae bacterium]|nr:aminotransferase class I/II-fold pyridoxal phosphate-dependent enzyme [Bacteroidaceae bacterium]